MPPVGDESLLLSDSNRERLPDIRERHAPHFANGWLCGCVAEKEEHLTASFLDMDVRRRVVVIIDVKAKALLVPDLWHCVLVVGILRRFVSTASQYNRSASVMQLTHCTNGENGEIGALSSSTSFVLSVSKGER
jgi:hypothetical protein